ncbi:MAG: hypothetical protein IT557_09945 [Alphaproteobacteria bacterium]|nr:hypothetical protein [Alphaproteobacteria bacterium]
MPAHITIGAISPRIQYLADGTQQVFAYPFPIFTSADLEVRQDEALLASGFTIAGAGDPAGGTVTFDVAPILGARITLRRRMPIQRVTDFQESGALRAASINDELDYQIAAIQQVADDAGRALSLPPGDPRAELVLPPVAQRAGKVVGFDNGGGLALMSTASTGALSAADVTYLAQRANSVARSVESRLSDTISVKDFGAVGNGTTDDRAAIQAAFDSAAAGGKILIPEGSYLILATVTLPAAADLEMRGRLVYGGSVNEPALVIGAPGQSARYRRYHGLRVERSALSNWSNEASVGIRHYNALNCNPIEILLADRFTIGYQMIAENAGVGVNTVYLGRLSDNKIGLDLRSQSAVGGYVNQNTFIGGAVNSGGNPLSGRYGVRFSRSAGAYSGHNNNIFLGTNFELGGAPSWAPSTAYAVGQLVRNDGGRIYQCVGAGVSAASGGPTGTGLAIIDGTVLWDFVLASLDTIPVLVEVDATTNRFIGIRSEGNGPTFARHTGSVSSQLYDIAFGWNDIEQVIDPSEALPSSVLRRQNRNLVRDLAQRLVWSVPDIRAEATRYSSTQTYVAGMAILGTGQTRLERQLILSRAYSGLTLRRQHVEVSNGRALGRSVDTREAKRFLMHYALDGQAAAGRQVIVCFDQDDRIITAGTPVRADKPLVYSSSYRGWYQSSGDSADPLYFELAPEVKSAFVGVIQVGAGANPRLRSMTLFTLDPVAAGSFPGYGEDDALDLPLAAALPNGGSYEQGARLFNATPAAGGRSGWVCLTAGTFGTLSSVTASTTNGSPTVTVNNASALEPGQWIAIAGAVTAARIERISGTTLTLSANATATVSSAATSFVAPVFAEWGDLVLQSAVTYNPPAIGSGGSVITTVTVTGAALGDYADASFSLDVGFVILSAHVTAANTVSVTFTNLGGTTADLASGTLRVRVRKQ